MPRSHTLPRTVAAALAITALAAPTALARPIDPLSLDSKDAPVFSGGTQDLRSPDAQDAASARRQDLRHLAAGAGITTSSLAGTTEDPESAAAYAQERYYSTSVKPTPVQASTSGGGDTDDGAPWAIFALSLAGAALAGAGGASLAGKTRVRARRARVTA
jgi:hypothetical protein